jgi:hypothetical protein
MSLWRAGKLLRSTKYAVRVMTTTQRAWVATTASAIAARLTATIGIAQTAVLIATPLIIARVAEDTSAANTWMVVLAAVTVSAVLAISFVASVVKLFALVVAEKMIARTATPVSARTALMTATNPQKTRMTKMMKNLKPRMPLVRQQRPKKPALTFSPIAYLKVKFACHHLNREVSGFGIANDPDRPLYIDDFVVISQISNEMFTSISEDALADPDGW